MGAPRDEKGGVVIEGIGFWVATILSALLVIGGLIYWVGLIGGAL